MDCMHTFLIPDESMKTTPVGASDLRLMTSFIYMLLCNPYL